MVELKDEYNIRYYGNNKNDELIASQVEIANCSEVDAIFVGGSLMMDGKASDRVKIIKELSNVANAAVVGSHVVKIIENEFSNNKTNFFNVEKVLKEVRTLSLGLN